MAVTDVALTARARGVATHLLSREALHTLTSVPDLESLARQLTGAGAVADAAARSIDAFEIEHAAGVAAGKRLHTLLRWQQRPRGPLEVFVADADRRSLRALLRGAAQGAPADARLRGLLATPSLPPSLLTLLSTEASPQAVVRTLLANKYPGTSRLTTAAEQTAPGLFDLEAALLDTFARRARRAAGRDRVLRAFVAETIDVGNIVAALLVAGTPPDVDPLRLFVTGGRWLTAQAFGVAAASSHEKVPQHLAAVVAHSPLAGVVAAQRPARVERAFLDATLKRLRQEARQHPLGTAPVLRILLLIDVQARDIRSLAWGAALGAPAAQRARELVTPP